MIELARRRFLKVPRELRAKSAFSLAHEMLTQVNLGFLASTPLVRSDVPSRPLVGLPRAVDVVHSGFGVEACHTRLYVAITQISNNRRYGTMDHGWKRV